jgi:hypothetical protein
LSSFEAKEKNKKHKEITNHRKGKKMQRKEGAYLCSPTSTFGMKCSSCLLSTFLQCWAFHHLQALCLMFPQSSCYSSSGALPSFGNGMNRKWCEGGKKGEIIRRGKFWGRKGGWKIPRQGKKMCFWFIPKIAWTASSWTSALLVVSSL